MSTKKFKFVSPGIFLNEIDNSQLPAEPRDIGPVVIGRTEKGPAMRPVQVDSFAEFVEVFGAPHPGGEGTDVWRNGNTLAPTYAAYAAQAWLKNSSTLNVIRLLGKEHQSKTSGGEAGWKIDKDIEIGNSSGGGAYGLWIYNDNASTTTGSLAAVWYVSSGSISLNNEWAGANPKFVQSSTSNTFTAYISGSSTTLAKTINFNLDPSSKDYIRKVFNTDPSLSALADEGYWLGETYERTSKMMGHGTGSQPYGVILGLQQGTNKHHNRQNSFSQGLDADSQTGWYVAQSLESAVNFTGLPKLFKIHDLGHGEWAQNNIKISIANINYSKDSYNLYGTFDVLVRRIDDTDAAPVILERFSNCNLNPSSLDFIGRKIGTQYATYDSDERRLITRGDYSNNSKYIRVQIHETVDSGQAKAEHLPFGVYGPLKYKDTRAVSRVLNTTSLVTSSLSIHPSHPSDPSILFPKVQLRASASQDGLGSLKDAFFGVWTGRTATSSRFNEDIRDLVKAKSSDVDQHTSGTYTENAFQFTLDHVSGTLVTGSEYSEFTYNDSDATAKYITSTSYKDLIDAGIDSFTTVLAGGSDGFDVTKIEPLANQHLSGKTEKTSCAFNAYKESINNIRDPEVVEYNIATIPGLTHEGLTTQLIETVESRADALAIIDLKGDFEPVHETADKKKSYGSVSTTITNLKNRGLNSSYACCYYPWVQIRDTIYGNLVYTPPSIAALGAMSYTDRVRAPWFSPAGFNRGGLSSGVAGLPVVNVTQKLTSKDRDKLYDANINPIATFPNEGIVIFGQKTMQVTRSALDRINVRRLLLFVKKGISAIAADVLFEPNVQETWDRFINRANPFLSDVKARFGLTDYKLILDKTTTTPDLIDQNVMYAKVFLKPARAIEFVAVDFVITNTGAAFED